MTAKKTSSTKKPRKKKRTKKRPFLKITSFLVLVGILGWATYYFGITRLINSEKQPEVPPMATLAESILIAANVNLASDLETYSVKDGVEHWKVHLSASQNEQVLKSLTHLKEEKSFGIKIGAEKHLQGQDLRLVTFSNSQGPVLKVILAEKGKKKPKATPDEQTSHLPSKLDKEPPAQTFWESYDGPKIAIVIDDIGIKPLSSLDDLLDLQVPITFAVLPFQRFSKDSANALYDDHYEVMLHMPMEPTNFPVTNPGAGALFSSFSTAKAKETLLEAIQDIPHAKGINNHMGSKVTAEQRLMVPVMDILRDKKLYFVDSRTHASTVAYDVALQERVPAAKRDIFLDATMSYDFTEGQVKELAKTARERGTALAIGHPYPSTIAALVDSVPNLKAQGFSFVFVSQVVQAPKSGMAYRYSP